MINQKLTLEYKISILNFNYICCLLFKLKEQYNINIIIYNYLFLIGFLHINSDYPFHLPIFVTSRS